MIMMVYLFFIFLCNRVVTSSAAYDDGLSCSNNRALQQELHGVEAIAGLNRNKHKVQYGSKYTIKQGQKGRRDAHGAGGGANLDRSHRVSRNIVQSKLTMSLSVPFGLFFLLLVAL